MKNLYVYKYTTPVFGSRRKIIQGQGLENVYGYSVQHGEGLGNLFGKLFNKVGQVFTKKAVEEAGKKVVQDVGKKALEQGTQFLTKKANEQLDKVFSNNNVVSTEKSDGMSREEIRRMKEVVNRIRRRRLRDLENDE
jgi:hypothetical protein